LNRKRIGRQRRLTRHGPAKATEKRDAEDRPERWATEKWDDGERAGEMNYHKTDRGMRTRIRLKKHSEYSLEISRKYSPEGEKNSFRRFLFGRFCGIIKRSEAPDFSTGERRF